MAGCVEGRAVFSLLAGMGVCGLVACGAEVPTTTSSAAGTATGPADGDGATREVPGQANIFGAGADAAPAPGGGGGGVLPTLWPLPPDAREVTFPGLTGTVSPIVGVAGPVGPGGDDGRYGTTDVRSFGGISGLVDDEGMYPVGVFLTDDPPREPAPERLDVTDVEGCDSLRPGIAQTFPIDDGGDCRVPVPEGATRLFVGFVDGYYYKGAPGWYGNNAGKLTVTVEVVTD